MMLSIRGLLGGKLSLRGIAGFFACAVIVCAAPGCLIIGLFADKAAGGRPVDAEYVPKQEPMLVLIENYANPDSVGLVADRISQDVTEEIKRNKIAPVVDYSKLVEFRTAQLDRYHHLDTAALGRELGAKQILYGHMVSYSLDAVEGSGSSKGHAKVFIRVIDARTGETRFPLDSGPGELVDVATPTVLLRDGQTNATLEDGLISKLAIHISWLFMSHPPDEAERGDEELTAAYRQPAADENAYFVRSASSPRSEPRRLDWARRSPSGSVGVNSPS